MKIMITTDSSADISDELANCYNIRTARLNVNIDGKTFRDGLDITPDVIFTEYKNKKILPKTSAASVYDYKNFFDGILNDGYDGIVHLSMSSLLSSSYGNALAAAEKDKNIHVVDSMNLSSGIALLVLRACEMRDRGMTAEEIEKELIHLRNKVVSSFIIDKLEFLHKGGRCSSLASFGANILSIRPRIDVIDGTMAVSKKYRGTPIACQLKYATDIIDEYEGRIDHRRAFITSTCDFCNNVQINKEIKKQIKFEQTLYSTAGCVISSHCGMNTIGVIFMTE